VSGPLDSITGSLIARALDASMTTHQAIANNIANVSTQGYRPVKVAFDDVMQSMQDAVMSGKSFEDVKQRLAAIDIGPTADMTQTQVQLDIEMVALAKNTTHYQALLGARDQLGGLMSLAIKGGR
jgi:flagellar basal-body rod protein FlgB